MKIIIIEGDFWPYENYEAVPELKLKFPRQFCHSKEASQSCPYIRMSTRCYIGNIGDCELIQEAKEMELGMC